MKKNTILLCSIICLQGCFGSSNFIPEGLAPPPTKKVKQTINKEDILRQEQLKLIEEGTKRRDEQKTHTLFIEAYKILKTIPLSEKTSYLEVLTTAHNIPEVTKLWKAIDEESLQNNEHDQLVGSVESLKNECLEIDSCKNNIDLFDFLTLLSQGLQDKNSSEILSKSFSPFTESYFNENNQHETSTKTFKEIAQAITKNEFEKGLRQKNIIENICPQIKETFQTSQEYKTYCSEKSIKIFEDYKIKTKKEEILSPENEFCMEFMTMLKRSDCEEINTEYEFFRKNFLEIEETEK